ncbi:MAG: cytochrome P450 [Paracoccaceae bacterium]|nr:cytochrome P450 [Paracoccaceae bacterium]
MQTVHQSPTDPEFVQNPYPSYAKWRKAGPMVYWQDYEMVAVLASNVINLILKDRRFGREVTPENATIPPARLKPFYDIEAHSMLELEPPRHTRLRRLVLRAFTSRRIASMGSEIEMLCHQTIDKFPDQPFDLIELYGQPIPVIVICRLLGVPEEMAPQLLNWSNAMVSMYQARRTREIENAAADAAAEFTQFMQGYIDERRKTPSDDLISELIQAEEAGDKLSTDEMITTCILLLNAGHEATVHTIGNGVKSILESGRSIDWASQEVVANTVEEALRFDPPLHIFTRYAYESVEIASHTFKRGDQIALMLGVAGRDAHDGDNPDEFDPNRHNPAHVAFGGGLHFCVGAPLARLELQIAMKTLFDRCPNLRIAEPPQYANLYHFHGLERLLVTKS